MGSNGPTMREKIAQKVGNVMVPQATLTNRTFFIQVHNIKCAMCASTMLVDLFRFVSMAVLGLQDSDVILRTCFILDMYKIAIVGLALLDNVMGIVAGRNRSPIAHIARMLLRRRHGSEDNIPLQPFVQQAALVQTLMLTFFLKVPTLLLPIIHQANNLETTATWLAPLLCNFCFIIIMQAGFYWKSCPGALVVGYGMQLGLMKLPEVDMVDGKKHFNIQHVSFTVLGPFFSLPTTK